MDQRVLIVGAALLAVVLLVLGVWLLWRHLRSGREIRRLERVLREFSREEMQNIVLPDGLDGWVWIDRLLLTPGGLVVLDVRNYPGNLFGGESIREWTQLIGVRSFKFDNPLYSLADRIQVVKQLAPGIPVAGRVVFTEAGRFPKGMPPNVSVTGSLSSDLAPFTSGRPGSTGALDASWERIKGAAERRAISE